MFSKHFTNLQKIGFYFKKQLSSSQIHLCTKITYNFMFRNKIIHSKDFHKLDETNVYLLGYVYETAYLFDKS